MKAGLRPARMAQASARDLLDCDRAALHRATYELLRRCQSEEPSLPSIVERAVRAAARDPDDRLLRVLGVALLPLASRSLGHGREADAVMEEMDAAFQKVQEDPRDMFSVLEAIRRRLAS